MNWQFGVLVVFFICLALSQPAEAHLLDPNPDGSQTEIDMFWERTCDKKGTCNLVLHSAPIWYNTGYSWKKVERANYINGTWIMYGDIDWDTYIWVEYCKEGSCYVCVNVSEAMTGVDVRIRKGTTIDYRMKFIPGVDYCNLYAIKDFSYFEFGSNSTLITLTTADTENLDDNWVYQPNPTNEYGAAALMYGFPTTGGYGGVFNIKWNLTSPGIIPAGQQIDAATVSLYCVDRLMDAGEAVNVTIHHVYAFPTYNISDQEWTEGNGTAAGEAATAPEMSWNTMPNEAHEFNSTAEDSNNFSDGFASGYYNWTATAMVGETYDGDDNITMLFNTTTNSGTPTAEGVDCNPKEQGSNIPILYITYSAVGDTTDPVVTLKSPADASTDADGLITAICHVNDGVNTTNVTLYHNFTTWHANSTNSSGINNVNYTFSYNIPIGNTSLWNCYACDNSSNCGWATANWSVTYSACVETLANTTQNTTLESCNTSDQQLNWTWWVQWDQNGCGFTNVTWYDNETLSCNYCSYNLTNTSVTDEGNTTPIVTNGTCNASNVLDYQMRNWTHWTHWMEWDTNWSLCCNVTSIGSDCHTNTTWYTNTTWGNYTYNVNCTYAPAVPLTVCAIEPMLVTNPNNEIEIGWGFDCDQNVVSGGLTTDWIDMTERAEPATPPTNTMRLYVEEIKGFGFIKFIDDTGMKREVVRDSMILVKNVRGTSIAANRIVYDTGSDDNIPTVDTAKADNTSTMPSIGVTIEAIANGSYGRVMQVGLLENVNTNSLTEGDILYVSDETAGIPKTTAPITPNLTQEIGTVLVKSATAGAIQIVARGLTGDEHGTNQNVFHIGNSTVQSSIQLYDETGSARCMSCWSDGVCNSTAGGC